jgi:hypothetical protein
MKPATLGLLFADNFISHFRTYGRTVGGAGSASLKIFPESVIPGAHILCGPAPLFLFLPANRMLLYQAPGLVKTAAPGERRFICPRGFNCGNVFQKKLSARPRRFTRPASADMILTMSDPSKIGLYKIMAQALSIGLSMALALALGFAAGWWADSRWPHLAPWGKMGGLGLGIAAAYRNLFVMFNRLNRPPAKRPGKPPKP